MKYVSHRTTNEPFGRSRQRLKKMTARVDFGAGRRRGLRSINARPLAYSTGGRRIVLEPRHISTNKGHLIALKFGGPDIQDNLVPMYGRFNKSGAWAIFEGQIEHFVDKTVAAPVVIEITCHYSPTRTDDQRIPVRFTIAANAVTGGQTRNWVLNHPAPRPVVKDQNEPERTRILALQEQIIQSGWRVEDQIDLTLFPDRRAAPVLPTILAERPYAFLDYEEWFAVRNSTSGLNAWRNRIMNATTQTFDGPMRAMVRLQNRILNQGSLISDEPDDPAYGGHAEYVDVYRWPGGAPGLLVLGGNDLEPEVDHIIPKSLGGFAIFSNASVVSAKENNDKRARVSAAAIARIRQTAGGNKKRKGAGSSDGRGSSKKLRPTTSGESDG